MVELTVERNGAVVFGDDAMDDGEPEASAMRFRTEERVKETGEVSVMLPIFQAGANGV